MNNFQAITAKQMAEVDRLMLGAYHIGLTQMMENAGRHLASFVYSQLNIAKPGSASESMVTILVGPGNNGGGGLTAARYLSNWGVDTSVILLQAPEKLKPAPFMRYQTLQKLGVGIAVWDDPDVVASITSATLIVDAMLGYNQKGDPYGAIREFIPQANLAPAPILSLDIPSGMDATTGVIGNPCIKADSTLTLAMLKSGLVSQTGLAYAGKLYLADIGVPPALYTHIGLPEQHLFKDNPIIKID